MIGTSLFLSLFVCCSTFSPAQSQGFQPIVHYVLSPVELFRIPRPDYQPQIPVLPAEDLAHLVVSHASNEYFRNLLINTVSYDPLDMAERLAGEAAVADQQATPRPCSEPPTTMPAESPIDQSPDNKTSPITAMADDVDLLNGTEMSDPDRQNGTGAGGMIARIIDDAANLTSADDEEDTGSVEPTTPRSEAEERTLNKSERIVTRRSHAPAPPIRVSPVPVGGAPGGLVGANQPRHYRRHAPHGPQARAGYGAHYGTDDDDSFDSDSFESDDDSSYSDSDSYEDEDNDDHTIDHIPDHNDHIPDHNDHIPDHNDHIPDHNDHILDHNDSHDIHDGPEDHHSKHPLKNDRFLGTHEILGDIGDDLFQFDHKNTDHKVLNYKRADKTVRPH